MGIDNSEHTPSQASSASSCASTATSIAKPPSIDKLFKSISDERNQLVHSLPCLARSAVHEETNESVLNAFHHARDRLSDVENKISNLTTVSAALTAPPSPLPAVAQDSKLAGGNQHRGLKVNNDMPRFEKDDNSRESLDSLNLKMSTHLSQPAFEAIYAEAALTKEERINQMVDMLRAGRRKDETYSQFAMRIARDIKACGIKDDNEFVLSLLAGAVHTDMLNAMITRFIVESGEKDVRRFVSINAFVETLSSFIGPALATKRRSKIGPSRHKNNSSRFDPNEKKLL